MPKKPDKKEKTEKTEQKDKKEKIKPVSPKEISERKAHSEQDIFNNHEKRRDVGPPPAPGLVPA